jgi:DNA-directed RNA polymerase III subunit RPC1
MVFHPLLQPIELWTGKQLFSVLVRPNAQTRVFLNLTVREKVCTKKCVLTVEDKTSEEIHEAMCPNDGFVYFRNSELLSGQVGKKTLGEKTSDGCAKKTLVISLF